MKKQIESYENCRSLVREILINKQSQNPRYSLRSFARQLGVQSSFLSMFLNGKRHLSEEMALKFCKKLNFSPVETKKLLLLLRLEKAQSSEQKSHIIEELEMLDPSQKGKRDLSLDQFKVIAEWYHLPLQLLVTLDEFNWSEENASQALGISTLEVRQALERLSALDLIDYTPGLKPKKSTDRLMVSSAFKNEALRKYHTQMLQKTIEALSTQEPNERFTGTQNITISSDQIKLAHDILKETMEKLFRLSEQRSNNKKIYHVNLNLIRLTKQTEGKKHETTS
jgi:uncharacterized protein (TIGR02147 family)